MTHPLLATKFHLPGRRSGTVARSRLIDRLNASSALTLISAPAGFGKTTLLADWLGEKPRVAWVSLDTGDSDPTLFWTYVLTALDRAAPGSGVEALSLLQSSAAPLDAVLATVLNNLLSVSDRITLVLDDFHLVESPTVDQGLIFLLDHLPSQLRLVMAGRADPALPLAKWRARGDLIEIRSVDLRFTLDETSVYLTEMMGVPATADEVSTLETRTEGWIAALQLAALSMRGREDITGFVAGFAGDDRYIVDYLAEEVLDRQPSEVRQFLLRTSILDRLSGSLCDAVVAGSGSRGRVMLAGLERDNMFLVPLDARREWYRYHQLFADVLQARLRDEHPAEVPGLHRRASVWFEQTGDLVSAIRHAGLCGDVRRAADLIERAIPAMRRTRQEATIHRWIRGLPDELVRSRPVLSVGLAGAMMSSGDFAGVEQRLLDAERLLPDPFMPDPLVPERFMPERLVPDPLLPERLVPDPTGATPHAAAAEAARVPGAVELYRAALAVVRGDNVGVVLHARRTLELAGADDDLVWASAAGLLGLAHWTRGDLEASFDSWSECIAGLYRVGHVADTFGCAIAQADIRLVQGRLGQAEQIYRQALNRAAELAAGTTLRGAADMHVGLARVFLAVDDLPSARGELLRSNGLGEHLGLPQNRYRWLVGMAGVVRAEGDPAAAVELLDEAERRFDADMFPRVQPVPAVRARVWVSMGRVGHALKWAREQGLSVDDPLSYLREYEHITLAKALLAAGTDVDDFLTRLLEAAEAGDRTGSVLEILVLQALSRGRHNHAALQRALTLAEPEGYRRIFLDEGAPMAELLGTLPEPTEYVRQLLAAFGTETVALQPVSSVTGRDVLVETLVEPLVETLSDRERQVLRMLGSDLNGPAIARQLYVSLNTVRTHSQRIYTKLGVSNRRAAVRRATELGLLP